MLLSFQVGLVKRTTFLCQLNAYQQVPAARKKNKKLAFSTLLLMMMLVFAPKRRLEPRPEIDISSGPQLLYVLYFVNISSSRSPPVYYSDHGAFLQGLIDEFVDKKFVPA